MFAAFAICVYGYSGSGKTSFLKRLTDNTFEEKYTHSHCDTAHAFSAITNKGVIVLNITDCVLLTDAHIANNDAFIGLADQQSEASTSAMQLYSTEIRRRREVPVVEYFNKVDAGNAQHIV